MRDYRDLVEIKKKCLYPYDSGVIQVNMQRSSDDSIKPNRASASWSPMIEIPARRNEHTQDSPLTLFDTMITCALHPTLSPNERISWVVNRFRLQ